MTEPTFRFPGIHEKKPAFRSLIKTAHIPWALLGLSLVPSQYRKASGDTTIVPFPPPLLSHPSPHFVERCHSLPVVQLLVAEKAVSALRVHLFSLYLTSTIPWPRPMRSPDAEGGVHPEKPWRNRILRTHSLHSGYGDCFVYTKELSYGPGHLSPTLLSKACAHSRYQ